MRFTQIRLHSMSVVVVIGEEAAEVLENLDPLELLSVHGKLLFGGLGGYRDCSVLGFPVLALSVQCGVFVAPAQYLGVCLYSTEFEPRVGFVGGMYKILWVLKGEMVVHCP